MNIRSKIFGGGDSGDESPVVQSKKPKGAKADALHSISVPREAIRKADTRDEDRHRLPDEQVQITYEGRDLPVQLINLSGGGAMVACDFEPKLWDHLQLHLGENGTIECAVRWIRGERVGLEFAHETRLDCSADKQAAVLREVIARSFPDIAFEAPLEAAEPHDYDEQRSDRRHPLIWSGLIHHDFQSTPIRLRNISSTGAMIECALPLRAGAEPMLELGGQVQISTTVAWVFGDSAG
ncbi:MAG: PilZ domain-containing protein, partial [Sphingomicrobium sp.]